MRTIARWLLTCSLMFVTGCDGQAGRDAEDRIEIVPRNVVLISLDTLAALHVGAYGYERDTSPALDDLAKRGVLFENAYTQQVWTLTSHLSLMSGLYPQSHAASERQAAWPAVPMLATILRSAGFRTAAFTGVAAYMNPRFGLGRGFERYVVGQTDAARDNVSRIEWLREQAALAQADPEYRFFMFAHYFDIHSDVGTDVPYDSSPDDRDRYLSEVLDKEEVWGRKGDTQLLNELEKSGEASERDQRVIAALYDAGVRFTDRVGLATLLAELDALGLSQDTLIIVTSDHGEEIFEHGKVSHQQPYEETARVPLVVAGPGVPKGVRVPELVELVDVMPTILGLLRIPVPSVVQGRDLSASWSGLPPGEPRAAHVDGILGGLPTIKWRYPSSITLEIDGRRFSYVNVVHNEMKDGRRRFLMYRDGALYDLEADPGQLEDVSHVHPEIVLELKRRLLAWYAENERVARSLESKAQSAGGEQEIFVPVPADDEAERLRALGYAE